MKSKKVIPTTELIWQGILIVVVILLLMLVMFSCVTTRHNSRPVGLTKECPAYRDMANNVKPRMK